MLHVQSSQASWVVKEPQNLRSKTFPGDAGVAVLQGGRGGHSMAWETGAAEGGSRAGELSPPKGASTSPNTPLSDGLLSHSPATSGASASEQRSPEASTPHCQVTASVSRCTPHPLGWHAVVRQQEGSVRHGRLDACWHAALQAAREEPVAATGCSPRSSGSLSVQSIRLCFPPALMHLIPPGPLPSSPLLAAADSAQPAVAHLPDAQWLAAIGTAAVRGEPPMQPQPDVPRANLNKGPEVAWQLPKEDEAQTGGALAPVRCAAAFPQQLHQQPSGLQGRPRSLLSMQLKDCSR